MEDGTQFGRYRLEAKLGAGAMGEVYRAYDTETDRVVAVKVLVPHLAEDQKFQARFRQEARTAASLNDPHVVPIHNFGEIDGHLYVDMRLIEGRDLGTVVANGPMPPEQAVAVVEQIASALDAAHRAGLVHRDVKPSNILVTERNFAYLIDFGIARGAESSGMTSVGHTIGTLAYMSPERFETGNADATADIYSLACVLHECLTGRRPFEAESMEQQIAAHMMAPPPRPSVLQLAVPASLDNVIAKGMAKNPINRYRTAPELGAAARQALAGQRWDPETTQRTRAPQPPTRQAPTQQRPTGYVHQQRPTPHSQSGPQPRTAQTPAAFGTFSQPHQSSGPQPTGAYPANGPLGSSGPIPRQPTGAPPGGFPPGGSTWWQRNLLGVAAAAISVITIGAVIAILSTSGGAEAQPVDLEAVLLTDAELDDVLDVSDMVTTYRFFTLPEDNSRITPESCYDISYSAGIRSYGDTGYLDMRESIALAAVETGNMPTVDQSIFEFPSAEAATAFVAKMSQSWQSCLDDTIISSSPGVDVKDRTQYVDFAETDTMLTISEKGADDNLIFCKRALGVDGAFIADVRACKDDVGGEAEDIVNMMFERV